MQQQLLFGGEPGVALRPGPHSFFARHHAVAAAPAGELWRSAAKNAVLPRCQWLRSLIPCRLVPQRTLRSRTSRRTLATSFRADYRQFLLQHNGGHPEPDAFLLNAGFGEEEDIVMCFFPMRDLKLGSVTVSDLEELRTWPLHCAWDDLQSDLENLYAEAGIEEPLLPIGTDGSSNYFCIVLEVHAYRGRRFSGSRDWRNSSRWQIASRAFLASLRERERTDYAFGSGPREPDRTYDKIGNLVTSGACVQCGGSGQCYCIRKGPGNPTGCVRCNGSGKCGVCQGSGKARR